MYSVRRKGNAMTKVDSNEIGARLREYRKRIGLTQEQLAEKTGVTFQQIQKYESGKDRMNSDRLQTMAEALSIPVAAFFGEVEGALSHDEQKLLKSYRRIRSADIRAFILNSVCTFELNR